MKTFKPIAYKPWIMSERCYAYNSDDKVRVFKLDCRWVHDFLWDFTGKSLSKNNIPTLYKWNDSDWIALEHNITELNKVEAIIRDNIKNIIPNKNLYK